MKPLANIATWSGKRGSARRVVKPDASLAVECEVRAWARRFGWRPDRTKIRELALLHLRSRAGDPEAEDELYALERSLERRQSERGAGEKVATRVKGDKLTRENLATGERVTYQRVDGAWEHYETETYGAETVPF